MNTWAFAEEEYILVDCFARSRGDLLAVSSTTSAVSSKQVGKLVCIGTLDRLGTFLPLSKVLTGVLDEEMLDVEPVCAGSFLLGDAVRTGEDLERLEALLEEFLTDFLETLLIFSEAE